GSVRFIILLDDYRHAGHRSRSSREQRAVGESDRALLYRTGARNPIAMKFLLFLAVTYGLCPPPAARPVY
ncbi:MAG: hypothetical protein ABR556_11955, partial [Pyrinomonadaceae bacterium]